MVTDRVGDFIIRLQNAATIGKQKVVVPYSKYLFSISKKLKELGFVDEVEIKEKEENGVKKTITATLTCDEMGNAKLKGVKRVSKPGRRLYSQHTSAHRVKGGTGSRIISSSLGVISDTEARKLKVGGEELFEIW